jgi:hypothetical protein
MKRKDIHMKIQALVAAVALVVAGGAAFAQTGTANSSAGGSGTMANTPSTTTSESASTSDAKSMDKSMDKSGDKSMGKMHHHAKKHHHASRHHKHRHVAMNDRDTMESMHHMGASRAPTVDIDSHDRQQRMDHAYDDWKKNHG